MGLFLSAFSYLLYFTLSGTLKLEMDNKLKSIAEAITTTPLRLPMGSLHKSQNIDEMLDYLIGMRSYGKFIQIIDRSGNVGDRSKNLERRKLPVSKETLYNASKGIVTYDTIKFEDEKYPVRIITYPNIRFNKVTNIVQVGSSMESVEETLDRISLILFILVPCALVIISFSGWFMASRALKPVDEITKAARIITAENLNQRIKSTGTDDEIGRLTDTINEMISRLQISFNQILQFSADVSHELRTPLTILRGSAEVALRQERTPQEYSELLISNLEEINRMQRIVEELLMLSRADMGEISITKERINLNKVLTDIKQQAEVLAMEKSISVELELKSVIIIMADELRIRQLLLNIISNAVKYSNEDGRIIIKAYEEGDFAYISVQDFGIGIDKKDVPNLFNRFFRVDKVRSRQEGGTGLGLSICKWIAIEHGGDILVDTEPGEGSTFIVKLSCRE
jgi:heavy metal sensor kinase